MKRCMAALAMLIGSAAAARSGDGTASDLSKFAGAWQADLAAMERHAREVAQAEGFSVEDFEDEWPKIRALFEERQFTFTAEGSYRITKGKSARSGTLTLQASAFTMTPTDADDPPTVGTWERTEDRLILTETLSEDAAMIAGATWMSRLVLMQAEADG